MFEKKYVFETKKTKLKRTFINTIFFTFAILLVFITLCVYIPIYGQNEYSSNLYKKAPDLIAIFTGGAGRIAFGLELAKSYPNAKIYISGVYNKNTVETLLEKQVKPHADEAEKKLEQSSIEDIQLLMQNEAYTKKGLIDIDYEARNTLENVIYTLHYLRKTKEHKQIAIISSDYHIFRIKWLMNFIKDKSDDFEFVYIGMKTNFNDWSSIKILIKETIKIVQTSAFLLIWDKENIPEQAVELSP